MTDRIKYRLKFRKFGRLRFIGHLDLLNVFQRAIKRAQLPIAYSQGFNPHQELSFALPLSLGYASEGEYLDMVFAAKAENTGIVNGLNKFLPEGIEVVGARPFAEGEKSAGATVAAAEYIAKLPESCEVNEQSVADFYNQNEIMVMKKTKTTNTLTDIKKDIICLEANFAESGAKQLKMMLSAGSGRSLRADMVVMEVFKFCEANFEPFKISYTRVDLFKEDGMNLGSA